MPKTIKTLNWMILKGSDIIKLDNKLIMLAVFPPKWFNRVVGEIKPYVQHTSKWFWLNFDNSYKKTRGARLYLHCLSLILPYWLVFAKWKQFCMWKQEEQSISLITIGHHFYYHYHIHNCLIQRCIFSQRIETCLG